MKSLRIALVLPIPATRNGELESVLGLLASGLAAAGHEVVCFPKARSNVTGNLYTATDATFADPSEPDPSNLGYLVNEVIADVLGRSGEFDLIHFNVSPAYLPFAALSRAPAIFSLHDQPERDDEWIIARHPEVVISGVSKQQVHAVGLRLKREVPFVHLGCDFESFEPAYEPGEYLAFFGAMTPADNPKAAIQIARAVQMPIVLAGEPARPEDEIYFSQEVKPLLDGKDVRWIGPLNQLQRSEFLRRAAGLLYPIHWDDPFGMVMIEAMACGCPVIAHRRGAVAEIVDNGITGFHTSVIDAMAELVPSAIALDRQQVRAHAASRFDHRFMVERYLEMYLAVLERS